MKKSRAFLSSWDVDSINWSVSGNRSPLGQSQRRCGLKNKVVLVLKKRKSTCNLSNHNMREPTGMIGVTEGI